MKTIKMLALAMAATTALASPAFAATTLWTGAGATDVVNFIQFEEYATINSGTIFQSDDGRAATFTTSNGVAVERRAQSSSWGGNFAPGAPLLWNLGNQGSMTFTFATGVQAIGAQIMADFYGPFTSRINLSDGSSFDMAGVSSGDSDNSAIFIGAQSTSANITSITFSTPSSAFNGNDFAIGNLQLIGAAAVPEPASWAMMILGMGAVGGALRRRSKVRTTVAYA